MDTVDATRTGVATAFGAIAAVLFSGYFALPGSLAVGLVAFVLSRRALGAVYYGPHGTTALFVIVGAAAAVEGVPPAERIENFGAVEGGIVVSVGLVAFVFYETILRVGLAADAGGFDEAGFHPIWKGPAAIVALLAGLEERIGLRGFEGSLGALATLFVILVHEGMLWSGVQSPVALAPVVLAGASAVAGTAIAATPRTNFDGSLQGSICAAIARAIGRIDDSFESIRKANRSATDGGTAASKRTVSTASGGDTGTDTTAGGTTDVQTERKTETPGNPLSGVVGAASSGLKGVSKQTRAAGKRVARGTSSTANTVRRGVGGTVDRTTDAVGNRRGSSDGGDAKSAARGADGAACQNCGEERPDVGSRVLVGNPPRATDGNEVRLCERCQSSRTSNTSIDRCRTGLPVDRSRVVAAAGQACQCCGRDAGRINGALEPHAVVPMDGAGHPHEHNVVALCPECHGAAHGGP